MYTIKKKFKFILFSSLMLTAFFTGHSQTISDNDLKTNISVISSPLQNIIRLQPRTFEYNTEKFKMLRLQKGVQYGFLANDVLEQFPELVRIKTVSYVIGKNNYRNSKIYTIDDAKLVPVLVAAMQQLYDEIEILKQQVQQLSK